VGGGGLISGIASFLKTDEEIKRNYNNNNTLKVIGCQPINDCAMKMSIEQGEIIEIEAKETLSDGTAGNIEPRSVTFECCKNYVDEWMLVEEEQIAKGLIKFLDVHRKVIEGAAALTVASLLDEKNREKWKSKVIVAVICGGNIGLEKLKKLL